MGHESQIEPWSPSERRSALPVSELTGFVHAAATLTRVAGYRRSDRGDNDAQLFAQSRTLRIRQLNGLDLSIVISTSPLGPLPSYLWVIFMRFRGPQALTRQLTRHAGTAKRSVSRTRHRILWVGLWVEIFKKLPARACVTSEFPLESR